MSWKFSKETTPGHSAFALFAYSSGAEPTNLAPVSFILQDFSFHIFIHGGTRQTPTHNAYTFLWDHSWCAMPPWGEARHERFSLSNPELGFGCCCCLASGQGTPQVWWPCCFATAFPPLYQQQMDLHHFSEIILTQLRNYVSHIWLLARSVFLWTLSFLKKNLGTCLFLCNWHAKQELRNNSKTELLKRDMMKVQFLIARMRM